MRSGRLQNPPPLPVARAYCRSIGAVKARSAGTNVSAGGSAARTCSRALPFVPVRQDLSGNEQDAELTDEAIAREELHASLRELQAESSGRLTTERLEAVAASTAR